MMRVGLVVIALVLAAVVLLGLGTGLGIIQVDGHGKISLVHKDDATDNSTEPQRVVSADDLLRQKGLTYQAPAEQPEAAKPAPAPTPALTQVASAKPTPAPTATPTKEGSKPQPTPNPAPAVAPVVPVQASAHESGLREDDKNIVRVAAGSDKPITDDRGRVWEASNGFEGGTITTHPDADLARLSPMYHLERWGPMKWQRHLPNGNYTVRLHFIEDYTGITGADQRLFNVQVQGNSVGNVDVFKEAGGLFKPLVKNIPTRVDNGTLTVQFTGVRQNPILYGIEVVPGSIHSEPQRGAVFTAIRIDAGSPTALQDSRGNAWEADSGFEGGLIVDRGPIAIASTDFPDIYRTEHYDMTGWSKPVPNGNYLVHLHFAETCDHVSDSHPRIFDMNVQGHLVHDFNVAREAGGMCKALVKEFHVAVADGRLAIQFQKKEDAPEINGIEVIPDDPRTAVQREGIIRIDAGSATALRDPQGNTWDADAGFEGGQMENRGPIAIANTDFPDLYRTEHWGMTAWSRAVPNGKYTVHLHFAETWDGINDKTQRIFHVNVQGQDLRDLNIRKEAGGSKRALVKTFHVNVTDGKLTIRFQRAGDDKNNPEINGIEVIPER